MVLRALFVLALLWPVSAAGQSRSDPAAVLVEQLEQAAASGSPEAVLALGVTPEASGLRMFAALSVPKPTRFIIKERDRAALQPEGERLLIEVFGEYDSQATITTWRADVVPSGGDAGTRRIIEIEELTTVSGLYKLALNPAKQFELRNLTVRATDLTLEIPSGSAFVAETPEGTTAVVLLGRGRMRFSPSDTAERTQVHIFGGEDVLTTDFDAVFIRVRPGEFEDILPAAALKPVPVVSGDLRRASELFDGYIGQTFNLDLRDLSRERWSLIPTIGDLIAEVRTRRLGSLTYARSTKDAEDITLFDRRRRRNIAVYASAQKLASRGRFYSEDELVDYDVLRQDVEVAFSPDRMWVEGTATLELRVRAFALATLTLRLAESLAVRSVIAGEYGRLLHLRVIGQNSVLVNLPATVQRNGIIRLTMLYSGRLEPQQIEREGIVLDRQNVQQEDVYIPVEPQYIYSNRSYWYPQNTVTDYAISRLRVTVPAEFDVVASGVETAPPVAVSGPAAAGQRPRKQFVFEAAQPLRYLSCVISRFTKVTTREMMVGAENGPVAAKAVKLNVEANPRQVARSRALAERAAAIYEYYGRLIGDAPYPAFTLAVTESDLPGGHSPAYFAILNQPLPLSPIVWRNDPVSFEGYPPYFLAHEIAHQWWGQGVGWKNYHEQWISEGFAQYFAALYAERDRGDDVFRGMLRQMRRWSIEQSPQGPVYLGYRLGHIKSEGRVFRAVVYNKGAMVLHMLRRLLGDEKFFEGVRQFYATWKFRKAGTDDFRVAMQKAAGGMDLTAFFDGWIYGASVPVIAFTSTVSGSEARIRFEHRGALIPTPVTVSISYADGSSEELVVAVTEQSVERTIPLRGAVRSIEANRDSGAVAEIER